MRFEVVQIDVGAFVSLIGISWNSLNTTVLACDFGRVAAVLVKTVPLLLVVFAVGASPSPSRLR
jgi:hypothetical protein